MREEFRQELQQRIAQTFSEALGAKPVLSDEEREKRREFYIECLYRAALKQV